MRKHKTLILKALLITLTFFFSCTEKEKLFTNSYLDLKKPVLSTTDVWLRENYTAPYNIEVLYKWNENTVDFNRVLYPPKLENVKPAMEAIKTIWLGTYNEVAGEDFVKKIAPRQILLIGGINVNPSGTIRLGVAESGARITFFNTDLINFKNKTSLTRFVSTIQHEYTHILNQTVPFDIETYKKITPSGYTSEWANRSTAGARLLGFISAYAAANENEDFAEMVTALLSNDRAAYNEIINGIPSRKARADIRGKEAIVANYFKSEFGIDIYELQRVATENIEKALN